MHRQTDTHTGDHDMYSARGKKMYPPFKGSDMPRCKVGLFSGALKQFWPPMPHIGLSGK